MDEEEKEKASCIQDRLRAAAISSKEIFVSWPIISLILIISIFIVARPKILTYLIGRKVLIPIFSELSLESRFVILFSALMVVVSVLQYNINKSLLRIEQQRNQPFLYAKIEQERMIFIENKGGEIAWNCEITLYAAPQDYEFSDHFDKIYPYSGEKVKIPEELWNEVFDVMIDIIYYTDEEVSSNYRKTWRRIFRNFGPIYDL